MNKNVTDLLLVNFNSKTTTLFELIPFIIPLRLLLLLLLLLHCCRLMDKEEEGDLTLEFIDITLERTATNSCIANSFFSASF